MDALADKMQNATSVVFVDYKGITVAQDTELRNKFREAGVEYSVVKNTLTRFAANKIGYSDFDEILNGTTAMASTTDDPIAPARIVSEFAKKNKNVLKIKGGLVEGKPQSVENLAAFGELPSKNALIAQVLGTFLAPISSLAFVLDQIRIQKDPNAAPAEEAAE
ncbi:MAG: 50S ribosomal protein L10 [Bacteroidales bacterium]|nr:50S ribosomal protein L10 [Bacteroidales bacterium]